MDISLFYYIPLLDMIFDFLSKNLIAIHSFYRTIVCSAYCILPMFYHLKNYYQIFSNYFLFEKYNLPLFCQNYQQIWKVLMFFLYFFFNSCSYINFCSIQAENFKDSFHLISFDLLLYQILVCNISNFLITVFWLSFF